MSDIRSGRLDERIDKILIELGKQNDAASKFQIDINTKVEAIGSGVREANQRLAYTNGTVREHTEKIIDIVKDVDDLKDENKKKIVIAKVNKVWVATIITAAGGIWTLIIVVLDHLLNKFFK